MKRRPDFVRDWESIPLRHDADNRRWLAPEPNGSADDVRVRDVARRVGLSQRRFIQVFTAEVGLTPKLYCRVRRFQRAREMVRNTLAPDWTRVAVECGYFDQSHLIRDFHAFSGLSPGDYLRRRSEQVLPNHVPQVG